MRTVSRRIPTGWIVVAIGMLALSCSDSTGPSDNTPPTPGNAGLILFLNLQPTSCALLWSPAADDKSPQEELEYRLVRSNTANIATADEAATNGMVIRDWLAGGTAAVDTGLTAGATYYYNVLVRDRAENASVYGMTTQTMPLEEDFTEPVPGDSGLLSFTDITATTCALSWTGAADNRSLATDLQYRLVRSSLPDIDSVVDAEAFGTVVHGCNWVAGAVAAVDTGLTPETQYYYNLLVRDEAGNVAAYEMVAQETIPSDKVYFGELFGNKVRMLDLVTEETVDIWNPNKPISGIALSIAGNRIYYSCHSQDTIEYYRLDGGGVGMIVSCDGPAGLALDLAGNMIYWAQVGTPAICRQNLSGGSVQTLVSTGLSMPYGIALDVTGGKMYWADGGAGKIQRADLGGGAVEDLVTGLNEPVGIALDLVSGKVYWSDMVAGRISRANLDGSVVEDLVTDAALPYGIALDLQKDRMYWTNNGAGTIQCATLDGVALRTIPVTAMDWPSHLALEVHVWDGG